MFPPPEILGFNLSWFELITLLSILITLLFGRWYFYTTNKNSKLSTFIVPLAALLIIGYFSTYLMAYLEGLAYYSIKKDPSFLIPFGTHKKFLGFIFVVFLITVFNLLVFKSKKIFKINDFLAVVICLFIMLEANACLFDGHGCYGRFTNLPWGMYFMHGSAPTLFPVHPTPIYITLSHLFLFGLLIFLARKSKFKGQLILVLLIGTSILNLLIELFKDNEPLIWKLNFSQIIYASIALASVLLLKIAMKTNKKL